MDDQFAIALCDKCERPTAHRIAEEKLQCVICYPKPNKELQNTEAKGSAVAGGSVAIVGREHRFKDFDPIIAFNHSCPACDKKTVNDKTKFCYKCGIGIEFTDY